MNISRLSSEQNNIHSVAKATYTLAALSLPAIWFITEGKTNNLVYLIFILFYALCFLHIKSTKSSAIATILFVATLGATHLLHTNTIPEELFGDSSPRRYILAFCTLIPIAYSTISWKKHTSFLILLSSGLGLIFHFIFLTPTQQWELSWQGSRVSFSFRNAQHAAVIFGTAALAAAFFTPRVFKLKNPFLRSVSLTSLGLFFLASLWGLVAAQTRAAWLGLMAAAAVALIALYYSRSKIKHIKTQTQNKKTLLLVVILTIIAASIYISGTHDRIAKRFSSEQISLQSLLDAKNFESQKLTSSGVRISSWAAAIDWLAERPVTGWGARSVAQLIQSDSRFTEQFKNNFGHLHNSYLEALISYGLVGAACMIAMIAFVGRGSVLAWKQKCMPTDVFIFAWSFFAFWATVNFFESYINYSSGFYLITVIGGFVHSFYLQAQDRI